MLEIVNGLSEKSLLIRSNLFEEKSIASIEFFLNMGDISKIESLETRKVYNQKVNIKKDLDGFWYYYFSYIW